MKNFKILLILLTSISLFFGCKKDLVQSNAVQVQTEQSSAAVAVNVPQKAYDIAEYVAQNGRTKPGYVGGTVFQNREGLLPKNVSYKEYDVNPKVQGVNRGPERIVLGNNSTRYYTGDHYQSFTKF